MKRTIAALLFLFTLGAGSMFAQDGYWRNRDIRRDEVRIAHDRRELRRDTYYGNYRAARHERRALAREYRDLNRDRYGR
jgi:cell division protein FtsB